MLSVEAKEHSAARPSYPKYRAPAGNNTALIEPPLAGRVIVPAPRDTMAITLGARSLGELARAGRRQLIEAAMRYTASYRDPLPSIPTADGVDSTPLLLTGHQAEIFHPGVWFKNFVASRLAAANGGVAIHLVIDTDLCRSASLRVPTGSVESPRVEAIAFDTPHVAIPYEERRVDDWQQFESFGDRAAGALAPLVENALVREWWPQVVDRARATGRIGLGIAQARHRLEGEWGLETLEIPQSHVCQLPVFHWFVAHLLHELGRFRAAYNDALAGYRQAHSIHNPAQPLPDLAAEQGWQETPLWVWTTDDPKRRPLFARSGTDEIELTDRAGWTGSIPFATEGDYTAASQAIAGWAAQGIRLRTRALATTLFSRLLLGDLFLHGIGGAKYDQVTDDLACRWLGVELPPFSALSATLRLPIEHTPTTAADLQHKRQQLRQLDYHPERHLPPEAAAEAAEWIEQKRSAVALTKTPENAADRHRAIVEANQAMQPWLTAERRRLESLEPQLADRYRATQLLNSREYAFCLFPAADLRQRLWRLAEE